MRADEWMNRAIAATTRANDWRDRAFTAEARAEIAEAALGVSVPLAELEPAGKVCASCGAQWYEGVILPHHFANCRDRTKAVPIYRRVAAPVPDPPESEG